MNDKRKIGHQKDLISRQVNEIDELKKQIILLENECKNKDILIQAITPLREEFEKHSRQLEVKRKEYESLITELSDMKLAMENIAFKNTWKWKLVRFLIK